MNRTVDRFFVSTNGWGEVKSGNDDNESFLHTYGGITDIRTPTNSHLYQLRVYRRPSACWRWQQQLAAVVGPPNCELNSGLIASAASAAVVASADVTTAVERRGVPASGCRSPATGGCARAARRRVWGWRVAKLGR